MQGEVGVYNTPGIAVEQVDTIYETLDYSSVALLALSQHLFRLPAGGDVDEKDREPRLRGVNFHLEPSLQGQTILLELDPHLLGHRPATLLIERRFYGVGKLRPHVLGEEIVSAPIQDALSLGVQVTE